MGRAGGRAGCRAGGRADGRAGIGTEGRVAGRAEEREGGRARSSLVVPPLRGLLLPCTRPADSYQTISPALRVIR